MNIQLFNFLEDYNDQIVNLLMGKIPRSITAYSKMPRTELKQMLEHLLDGYIDLLVTGQTEALDKVFRYMSRVHAAKKFKVSDVLGAVLMFPQVIRRLLAEEYADIRDEDAIRKFNQALEQTESTAHRAACSFVDIFQEHVSKRIQEHNDYLDEQQKKFGIDLSRFIVFKA
ncbi:MAG: hypothetical protein HYZ27_07800 [Deltaproteobacteria bacterium]|nr:hypothetical protein [Deltaproteobacteria bacterium]